MDFHIFILTGGFLAAVFVLRADLHRRRLSLAKIMDWHFLTVLDLACPAAITGFVAALGILLLPVISSRRALPLDVPAVWKIIAGILIVFFVWQEGRCQVQFQRPAGIVLGETLILLGAYLLFESWIFKTSEWPDVVRGTAGTVSCAAAIVAGGIVIAVVVPPFVKGYEGHRILDYVAQQGESVQAEYTPPTHECPRPELWKMADSQTTELEIIDFLKALVVAVKPQLIVETGTFLGYTTVKMAEGLKENGFGKIITIEYDPAIFAKAQERIKASGLSHWIDSRNASSLDTKIEGAIDILFSDSHLTIREKEIRRFLPQVDPRGLILIHDASSHFKVVREAALRMEKEGLLSVVLLSTPRGLVIAQKREGRI
jgi:predicted O-methyltransferase YrrM